MLAAVLASLALSVTIQGDSLTVPSAQYTRQALPGHTFYVDAKSGRGSAEGLRRLRHQKLGRVVVFALGTNDDYDRPEAYAKTLRSVRRHIGQHRCLVIPSIYALRPYRKLNRVVHRYADVVTPWVLHVASGRINLTDGVHPGYVSGERARGRLIAKSIRKCASLHR